MADEEWTPVLVPERHTLTLDGTDPVPVQPLLDRLRGEQRVICAVRPVRETLEDLFMRAVTNPETGEVAKPGAAFEGKESRP